MILQQVTLRSPGAGLLGAALVTGLVWGWAFPVFMLIWLRRDRIRAEAALWV